MTSHYKATLSQTLSKTSQTAAYVSQSGSSMLITSLFNSFSHLRLHPNEHWIAAEVTVDQMSTIKVLE